MRGGKREGSGRKKLDYTPVIVTVRVHPDHREAIKKAIKEKLKELKNGK